jgi:hypothetical protein
MYGRRGFGPSPVRVAVGSHNPSFELGPLAGRLVIDAVAISQIIESRGVPVSARLLHVEG